MSSAKSILAKSIEPAITGTSALEEAKSAQHADEIHARLGAVLHKLARVLTQADLAKICDDYKMVVEDVRAARGQLDLIKALKKSIPALYVKPDAIASARLNTEEREERDLDSEKAALMEKIEAAHAAVECISKELEGRLGAKDKHSGLFSRGVELKRNLLDVEVTRGWVDGTMKVFQTEDGTEYSAVVPMSKHLAGPNLHPKVSLDDIEAIVSSDASTTTSNYASAQKVCDSAEFVLHGLEALLALCAAERSHDTHKALEAMLAVYREAGEKKQRVFLVLVGERSNVPILTQRYHTFLAPEAKLVKATLKRLYQSQGPEDALKCMRALETHLEGAVAHMTKSGSSAAPHGYYILPEVWETQDERSIGATYEQHTAANAFHSEATDAQDGAVSSRAKRSRAAPREATEGEADSHAKRARAVDAALCVD